MRGHFRWPRFITRREKPSRRRQEPPIGDAGECRGTYEGAGKAFEQSLFLLPGGGDFWSDPWSDQIGPSVRRLVRSQRTVRLLGSENPQIGEGGPRSEIR
jgi:hypothetical protein